MHQMFRWLVIIDVELHSLDREQEVESVDGIQIWNVINVANEDTFQEIVMVQVEEADADTSNKIIQ